VHTFFVTILTDGKKNLLQKDQYASLLVDCLLHYRDQGKFALHAFVIMPDHAHIVLSPLDAHTVERSVQFIKGAFSYRMRKELGYQGAVWRQSFHDRRLRDEQALSAAIAYTHQNPVRRGLVSNEASYQFSSAHPSWLLDAVPPNSG
jgi:putative transposase